MVDWPLLLFVGSGIFFLCALLTDSRRTSWWKKTARLNAAKLDGKDQEIAQLDELCRVREQRLVAFDQLEADADRYLSERKAIEQNRDYYRDRCEKLQRDLRNEREAFEKERQRWRDFSELATDFLEAEEAR